MDQSLAAMYQTTTTQRTVAHSEVKTSIFDGLETKEVIQSSYFSQDTVESAISPRNILQKSSILHYESPKKPAGEIISKIEEESPNKLKINNESPIAKNPFAKKNKNIDESPKLNRNNDDEVTILDLPDSKDTEIIIDNNLSNVSIINDIKPITNNPFAKTLNVISDNPSQEETQELTVEEIVEDLKTDDEDSMSQRMWSSQSSNSDLGSQLDRFRFRRPLFKKSSQSEDSQPEAPKSPILGKRKRNENHSPSKSKVTSRYVIELALFLVRNNMVFS